MDTYYTVSHPCPPDNTLYDVLLYYMGVTRGSVTYIERKFVNGIDLLELFDKYSRAVDPMESWLMELDIGEMTLSEAKFKMRQALMLQKDVEKAWGTYFKDQGSLLSADIITNPQTIRAWNPNFQLNQTLEMEQLRIAMREKTLHLSCCSLQGPSFHQWNDVVKHLGVMTVYRNDLRTYVPDEAVISSRRAAAVKSGAAIQRKRVEDAKLSPHTQNIYQIKMLQTDLEKLH